MFMIFDMFYTTCVLFVCPLQLATNAVLLLASNCLGLLSYFLADKQQRTAFLETRQCLEMKMVIEEQSAEQVRNVRTAVVIVHKTRTFLLSQNNYTTTILRRYCRYLAKRTFARWVRGFSLQTPSTRLKLLHNNYCTPMTLERLPPVRCVAAYQPLFLSE